MKTCRILYENACCTGFRNLSTSFLGLKARGIKFADNIMFKVFDIEPVFIF